MSFQRQYDVVQCRTTSYRRWNDVVCLLGRKPSHGLLMFDNESCILKMLEQMKKHVSPFHDTATGLFLFAMRTSENLFGLTFSDVFRKCKKWTATWNGLTVNPLTNIYICSLRWRAKIIQNSLAQSLTYLFVASPEADLGLQQHPRWSSLW